VAYSMRIKVSKDYRRFSEAVSVRGLWRPSIVTLKLPGVQRQFCRHVLQP